MIPNHPDLPLVHDLLILNTLTTPITLLHAREKRHFLLFPAILLVLLDHTALTILSPSIYYSLVVVCVHEFGICAEAHEHTPQHDDSGWMMIEPSEQYGQGA